MKKILILSFIFVSCSFFGQTTSPITDTIQANSYNDAMDLTFGLLPKSHYPSGVLFTKSGIPAKIMFANGLPNDSSFNMFEWYFAQNVFRNSSNYADSIMGYIELDSVKNLYISANNILPFGILNINGQYIRDSALMNGSISVQNYRLIENTSDLSKIYGDSKLFCIAPLNVDIYTFNPQFIFKKEFLFTNDTNTISKIEIDLGDGLGYHTIQYENTFQASYSSAGMKQITTRMIFNNGDTLYSNSELYVNDNDLLNRVARYYANYDFKYSIDASNNYVSYPSEFTPPPDGSKSVEVGVWWGCHNFSGEVRKPIVIFGGYNPKDGKSLEYNGYPDWVNDNFGGVMGNALGGWRGPLYETYNGWFTDESKNASGGQSNGPNGNSFLNRLRNEGYDIFIVRFMDGVGYLQHNAHLVSAVIKDVNDRINNSSYVYNPGADLDPEAPGYPATTQLKKPKHEIVVAGYSAGALSSRMGLLLMEYNHDKRKRQCFTGYADKHRVKTWIGVDCENQGSNTPIGFQMFLEFQKSVWAMPANVGDVVNSVICKLALDLIGHNGVSTQNTLYHVTNKYNIGNNSWKVGYHNDFANYFADLTNISAYNPSNLVGYPKDCYRICVSQGSANGVNQKINSEFDLVTNTSPTSWCISPYGTSFSVGNYLLSASFYRKATARVLTTWNNNAFSMNFGMSIKTLLYSWHINIGHWIYHEDNYVYDQYKPGYQPYDVCSASTLPAHKILGKKMPLSFENLAVAALSFCNSKTYSRNLPGFSPTPSTLDIHLPGENTLPRLPNLSFVPGNVSGGLNLMQQNKYGIGNDNSPNNDFGFPHLTYPINHYDYTPFDAIWANTINDVNYDDNTIHVEDPNPLIGKFLVEEIAPYNLYLSNRTIKGETYTNRCTGSAVQEKYYADFEARNSVLMGNQSIYQHNQSTPYERVRTPEGDFVVDNGGVVTVRANNSDGNSSVVLGAGFSAKHGSIFRAYVFGDNYCAEGQYPARMANSANSGSNTGYFNQTRPISTKRATAFVKNAGKKVNVAMYPNPTNGSVNYVIKQNETFQYVIYNVMGEVLQEGVLKDEINSLNLSSFNKGVYLISISNENYTQTDRIILQ